MLAQRPQPVVPHLVQPRGRHARVRPTPVNPPVVWGVEQIEVSAIERRSRCRWVALSRIGFHWQAVLPRVCHHGLSRVLCAAPVIGEALERMLQCKLAQHEADKGAAEEQAAASAPSPRALALSRLPGAERAEGDDDRGLHGLGGQLVHCIKTLTRGLE
eukprot:scaffold47736_cov35-Tisochrysis_lutea.AAC.1